MDRWKGLGLVLPVKVLPSGGYGAWIIFQNEATSTQDVGLDVRIPIDPSDIKVERLFISGRQVIKKTDGVLADEPPLVCCEKVQTRNGSMCSLVQSNLKENYSIYAMT